MSDVNTLRLATVPLTPQLLSQFVTYQKVMREELSLPNADSWPGRYAFAHAKALAQSGLDPLTHQKLRAMVGAFCGRQSTLQTVEQRLRSAEGTASDSAKARAMVERARSELPKLGDFSDFAARYGAEALALLQREQGALLPLHRELARIEGVPLDRGQGNGSAG